MGRGLPAPQTLWGPESAIGHRVRVSEPAVPTLLWFGVVGG